MSEITLAESVAEVTVAVAWVPLLSRLCSSFFWSSFSKPDPDTVNLELPGILTRMPVFSISRPFTFLLHYPSDNLIPLW